MVSHKKRIHGKVGRRPKRGVRAKDKHRPRNVRLTALQKGIICAMHKIRTQGEKFNRAQLFSQNDVGKGGVTRLDYCDNCLGPFAARTRRRREKPLLLEDNAKIHKSNFTMLYRKHRGITSVTDHPANSCDLNPCEFVWSWLKKEVCWMGPPSREAMVCELQAGFDRIPEEVIETWINTYWDRLDACVRSRGDWVGERSLLPRRLRK